jgi:hypothetical protein
MQGTMCDACDTFDTEIAIHGPNQFRRMEKLLQEAVWWVIFINETARARSHGIQQEPFETLDLGRTIPDVLMYDFRCKDCGAAFCLDVESYHGQGGSWSKMDPA